VRFGGGVGIWRVPRLWVGGKGGVFFFFFGVDQDIIILLSESNRSVGAGWVGGLGVKLMGTGGGVWLKERTGVGLAGFTVVEALN